MEPGQHHRIALTREQAESGLWGLLVGDAVGVHHEFHYPHALPPLDQIDLVPPAEFPRAHAGVPPGTWSDDGAQVPAQQPRGQWL
jgi:ADP-ribosylglycohydrolase